MFNELMMETEIYKAVSVASILYDNIFTDYDKKFIDELLKIEDIIRIDIDHSEEYGCNTYNIILGNDAIMEEVCSEISSIYNKIMEDAYMYIWDIIDTYEYEENASISDGFYTIYRKVKDE